MSGAAGARIERLRARPADRLVGLLAESEREGLRFVRRLVAEWASGANRVDRRGEALFVARVGRRVVGVCGLNVDPYAGDPRVGRVRHLFVRRASRRHGLGRRLVGAVVKAARRRFGVLRLSTSNPAAAALYESLGFRRRAGRGRCTHRLRLAPASLSRARAAPGPRRRAPRRPRGGSAPGRAG